MTVFAAAIFSSSRNTPSLDLQSPRRPRSSSSDQWIRKDKGYDDNHNGHFPKPALPPIPPPPSPFHPSSTEPIPPSQFNSMALPRHIDTEDVIKKAREADGNQNDAKSHTHYSAYANRYTTGGIPTFSIPDKGIDPEAAYQLIHDEMDLDGKPNLNLASFVGTYVDRQATQLMNENMTKNLSDSDEYPSLMAMHARCVSMLGQLWHGEPGKPIGTATTGSSEAIHLGGLAMKRRWHEKRVAKGLNVLKPNVLMGSNAQVALEKFACYFEVEPRILPVSEESNFCLDPKLIKENLDENTIGIFVILGSTYTGHYEPVKEVAAILDEFEKETGHDIPIHVDGASGAMVAPFVHPSVEWDFRVPRVLSINTSGHKFGLVPAGLGWAVFRSQEYLPKHLLFTLHYLGGTEETYTLNFSRPGAQVVVQYYNFINLGMEGYKRLHSACLENARFLSRGLEGSGYYTCVSDIHRKKGVAVLDPKNVFKSADAEAYNAGLPVVAFRLTDQFKREYPHVKQASISTLLRVRQWIIPNYPLPPNEQETEILRVVVRDNMSAELLARLLTDIIQSAETLISADGIDENAFAGVDAANTAQQKHGRLGHQGNNPAGKDAHQKRRAKGIFARSAC